MDKVAVLVPCYNEAQTIEKVVRDFHAVLPENSHIYVYDNNSTDGTAEIAARAGAVVRYEYEQGKGNVIRRMFREVQAECYILTDGDDTYPAESAPEMIRLVLERNCDMVIGDRLSSTYFEQNTRPFHGFGNMLVRKSINILFHSSIQDIMTGYRAFSYQFVKTFPILSKGFEIETEMSIHAVDKNMSISNVVVEYRDRPANSVSKLNTYSDGMKVLHTIWKLFRTYQPLKFYGVIAGVLAVISLFMVIPVFREYFHTGLVPRFPTLIVSGFLMMSAIQSFFSGMVLETIKRKNRQDFELKLIDIHRKTDKADME